MPRILAPALLLAIVTTSVAQERIDWQTNPQAAIAQAQRDMKPLMVYVLASSSERDDDIERAQKQALSDARVLFLSQRFVPLRLSRSVHREILSEFGLPEHANMMMAFVAPDGTELGPPLSAGGVGQVDSLIFKLRETHKRFRQEVYSKEVKPVLNDAQAKPKDLRRALELVVVFQMTEAEKEITEILDRPRLNKNIRTLVYQGLAALSTSSSIKTLLDRYKAGDRDALRALEKTTPVGAEILLAELDPEAKPFNYPIYEVITKVCSIKKHKPERFFENAKDYLIKQEIEHVEKIVKREAQAWKSVMSNVR